MTIARVQGNKTDSSGGTPASSIAVTRGAGSAAAMRFAIVTWGGNNGTNGGILTSVTDDQGNSYNAETASLHPSDDNSRTP
jgi:hypothetical protein